MTSTVSQILDQDSGFFYATFFCALELNLHLEKSSHSQSHLPPGPAVLVSGGIKSHSLFVLLVVKDSLHTPIRMIAERTFSHFLENLFLKLGSDPNT